jgi:NAD(P)-dependent dehydrogenase (short-subunit alcohol dehydrogenase family)
MQPKIVLITGASGGLGRALVRAFARQGSRIAITGRSKEKLEALAEEISREGSDIMVWPSDITQLDQVSTMEAGITRQLGTVEILINNAGIARAAGFLEMTAEFWEEVLKTNLTGTYHCCKAFLPGMIHSGWGRIINIASTTAKVAYSHASAYTASKHAVLGLTRALALETAKLGVTVNAICPGYLDTDLTYRNAQLMATKTGKSVEAVLSLFCKSSPQNRLIAPEEVAEVALLIASERAAGMTGQAINVDGGAVMI